jgi:hypothetical protein
LPGKRSVEELELAGRIGARGRSARSHGHVHMLPWRTCQSLANNSPPAANRSAERHLEPERHVANAPGGEHIPVAAQPPQILVASPLRLRRYELEVDIVLRGSAAHRT